jgi:hypothetical protein
VKTDTSAAVKVDASTGLSNVTSTLLNEPAAAPP